jgi:hypothetical protein
MRRLSSVVRLFILVPVLLATSCGFVEVSFAPDNDVSPSTAVPAGTDNGTATTVHLTQQPATLQPAGLIQTESGPPDAAGGSGKGGSPPPPPPAEDMPGIIYFKADRSTIFSGESAMLVWSVTGNTQWVNIEPGVGSAALTGTATVSPTATTSYRLTAGNTHGNISKDILITVGFSAPQYISDLKMGWPGGSRQEKMCPNTITYEAMFNAMSNFPMAYYWEHGDGVRSTSRTVDVAMGNNTITYYMPVSSSAIYKARICITSPEVKTSDWESIVFICKDTGPAVIDRVNFHYGTLYTRSCPYAITFSATVITSTAGTVDYQWEMEDGLQGPVGHLVYAGGPGSQTVTYQYNATRSGTYRARLKFLEQPTDPLGLMTGYMPVSIICSNQQPWSAGPANSTDVTGSPPVTPKYDNPDLFKRLYK